MPLPSSVLFAAGTAGWHGGAGSTFPNASNTGVPPGTVLTTVGTGAGQVSSGPGWTMQTSGGSTFVKVNGLTGGATTTLRNLRIPYNVSVKANNVLIQNCLITAPPGANGISAANIAGGTPPTPSANVTIDHCTITSQTPVSAQPVAFTATSASPCVFTAPGTAFAAGNMVTLAGSSLPPGFGDVTSYSFTASASTSVFTAPGTAFTAGQPVTIVAVSGQAFPGGFTAGSTYYVVNPGIAGAGTFQFAASSGGSPVTVTSNGQGTTTANWYYVYSMTGPTSFTLAYSAFPNTPLASAGTGSGFVQQLNPAWTLLTGFKDVNGDTLGLSITSCDISNATTGIQLEQGLVQGNYIHDLNYINNPGPGSSHLNGMTSNGVTAASESAAQQLLTIKGNTSLNPWTETDAISLFTDNAGQMHRVIDGNLIAGGGYPLYCGAGGALHAPQPVPTDITIINNRFSTLYYPGTGLFGYATGWTSAMTADPSNVWSNNAVYETGAPLNHP